MAFDFTEYCWSFYAPNEIYGHFFDNTLTRAELEAGIRVRKATGDFAADSFDREAVRDIILAYRGQPVQGCPGINGGN